MNDNNVMYMRCRATLVCDASACEDSCLASCEEDLAAIGFWLDDATDFDRLRSGDRAATVWVATEFPVGDPRRQMPGLQQAFDKLCELLPDVTLECVRRSEPVENKNAA